MQLTTLSFSTMNSSSTYISEVRLLETQYETESIEPMDLERIYFDSLKNIFTERFIDECRLTRQMADKIRFYIQQTEKYLCGNLSENEIGILRSAAWEDHDHATGIYKHVLRALVFAMGNKEQIIKDDGADYVFDFMFGFFLDFDEKHRQLFKESVEHHPKLQKYRVEA